MIRSICERLYDESVTLIIPSEVVNIPNRGKITLEYSIILEAMEQLIEIKQKIEEEKGNVEERLFYDFLKLCTKLKKQVLEENFINEDRVYGVFTLECYLAYTYCDNDHDVFYDKAVHYTEVHNQNVDDKNKQKNKMKRERQKEKKREERSKIRSFVRIKRPQPGAVFTGIIKSWDC
jgi:organic radical activating enzyme